MAGSEPANLQRFFLHYPEGHRLYVCIADHERRPFDFSDNTFKPVSQLSGIENACVYAEGRIEGRADHGCSYSVEIDLARLLAGDDCAQIETGGSEVSVHWFDQAGDSPDVKTDKQCEHCRLRLIDGKFEPVDNSSREQLDETIAFERRARFEEEYRSFILREIDSGDVTRRQLATSVREGNVAAVLRVLAKDICEWAGNLKPHLLHQISHLAKDPFFVRSRMVPENAPFQVFEHWAVREWIGIHEAYNLLEFHKSAEFARSFSQRLDELHQNRVEYSRMVTDYTVQHRGEDVDGVFVLDEARKDLKHMALRIAEYIDVIAQQFEAEQIAAKPANQPPSPLKSNSPEPPAAASSLSNGGTLLRQFADALTGYSTILNRVILEALHPEIESFEDAVNWTTGRQADLDGARQNVERLAGRQLAAAVIPPEGTRSEEWTVQLLALVAESFHAISYVFTSGPPQSNSDDPRAKMAAAVVSRQLETASQLLREIDSKVRHIEATCLALRPDELCAGEAKLESRTYDSGEIVYFSDRVELCGVDICSGPRSASRRVVLELLSRRREDGLFISYSGDDLELEAKRHGAKGTASGWIRDLRGTIMISLRKRVPSIVIGQNDVILSGGPGYRFADSVSVQFRDPPTITDITDTSEAVDVLNDDVRDVFDVRDDAASARRTWILQELAKDRRLKAPDIEEHFGCSLKTAQRDLTALKDEGKVEFVGASRTGFYRIRQASEAS